MIKKFKVKKILSLLIYLLVIWYFLKYKDFIIKNFSFDLRSFIIFIIIYFLAFVSWSIRTMILDRKKKNLFFYIKLHLLGFVYNNLLPLKLGDIFKILLISKYRNLDESLNIIILDRVGDLILVTISFILMFFLSLLGVYEILFFIPLIISGYIVYYVYKKLVGKWVFILTLTTILTWYLEAIAFALINGKPLLSLFFVFSYVFLSLFPIIPQNSGIYEFTAIFISNLFYKDYKEFLFYYSIQLHIYFILFLLIIIILFLLFDRNMLFIHKQVKKEDIILIKNKLTQKINMILNKIKKIIKSNIKFLNRI